MLIAAMLLFRDSLRAVEVAGPVNFIIFVGCIDQIFINRFLGKSRPFLGQLSIDFLSPSP